MNNETIRKIEKVLCDMMEKILKKRIITEPFIEEDIEKANPFGYRLVPIEIWKGSKFERSFVTSLGQKAFEQLAKIIAEGTGAIAENQHVEEITINTWRKEKTDEILSLQRKSEKKPNWAAEVDEILALKNNKYEDLHVIFDLYIKRKNGKEEFYSIKTVKPNLDQTERAKRDMLYTKSCKEECEVYLALPFNPAGEGGNYREIHSIPYRLFEMDQDECVLIGSEFWNKVGEDENTYTQLLDVFERVGKKYSRKIKEDYLGLK